MRMQRARSDSCALVQSLPSSSRFGSVSERANRSQAAHFRTVLDPYGITAHITHIDRVIIRAFLRGSCCALTAVTPRAATVQEFRGHWMPGGTLPDGFLTQPLPAALECKLSALSAGFERLMLGRDVLLVSRATREIVDVMTNADA